MDIDKILKRYGDLDGAVVSRIEFTTASDISQRTISIELKAFLETADSESGWRAIRISTTGRSLFGWCEAPWDTNLVLNYPVKSLRVGECDIIDFDPLHANNGKTGIALSPCFLGGAGLRIEELTP